MVRPATPLSVLFFAAFALLLLSVLSTPIIKAIPLANFQGVDFGVLGYCEGDKCSGLVVGYTTDGLFSEASDSDFSLPSSARHSLSSILIVHPVAALLTLICAALAIAAHFHSPAHSPRYLLALLLLTFPTLLVSLLAFLVDVLLFNPHMQWGSWIVLAATIIITACSVVTCAMRRTLVSRKARQKRIAENAEMNGANYYNQRAAAEQLPKADSPPPLSTGNSVAPADKMPEFATFELQQKKSDDRTPLNQPDPSVRSGSTTAFGDDESSRYGAPGRMVPPVHAGRGRPSPPRDQYGNIIPPNGPNGPNGPYGGPPLRHQGSNNTMGSNRSGGPPPFYRGRGGPPRGGFPPRGGPYGGRGGPQGFRGPPPPGWNGGRGAPMMGPGPGPGPGPMMGRGQRGPSPPGYGGGYGYDEGQNAYIALPPPMAREQSPGPADIYNIPRNMSPPQQRGTPINDPIGGLIPNQGPIGQAIEMDDRGGLAPIGTNYGLRDSDADVQGMVGLQQQLQQQRGPESGERRGSEEHDSNLISPTSNYTDDAYVPVRSNWNNQPPPVVGQQYNTSSGSLQNSNPTSRGLSPIQASPVELPAQLARSSPSQASSHKRTASSDYYEDVDPRFAEEPDTVGNLPATTAQIANEPPLPTAGLPSSTVLPVSLVPAGYARSPSSPPPGMSMHLQAEPFDHNSLSNSYEDLPDGARSPAASEASHFTSVSQRGINPQWRPPPPPNQGYNGGGYGRRPRQDDVLFEQNPDFALPGRGMRGGMRGGRGGGMRGGMRDPGQIGMGGMGGMGRYPTSDAI